MTLVARLRSFFTALFRRRRVEREMDQEWQFHLDSRIESLTAGGLSRGEAERRARLEFGDPLRWKEQARESRGLGWLQDLGADVRYGCRQAMRAPAFAATVILTLGLGVGANTALFTRANTLLLAELPVHDPDSLVRLRRAGRNDMVTDSSDYGFSGTDSTGLDVRATFSYAILREFQAANRTMSDLFACAPLGRVSFSVNGVSEAASAFISSGNYYRVLGVSAALGRTITPEDDDASAPGVAVISDRYWRTRFGANPAIVGTAAEIKQVPVTIVGVLPPSFSGVQRAGAEPPDVAVPLSLDRRLFDGPVSRIDQPTNWWLQIMGRLRPGATAPQIEANLGGLFQATARAGMEAYLGSLTEEERGRAANRSREAVPRLIAGSGARGIYDAQESAVTTVRVLAAVVALVLLAVCANVANLLVSRATARRRELAIRLSLGATRGRLARQLLTETVLLASSAGLLALAVAHWGVALLPGAPGQSDVVDVRVLSFTGAVAIVTGLIVGLVPAFRSTRNLVEAGLKAATGSAGHSRRRLDRTLLAIQVAVSVVLLIGAGLFLQTVQNLRRVSVGFNPENLVLFRLDSRLNRYDAKRTAALFEDVRARLESVPGVRVAAFSDVALLSGAVSTGGMFVPGRVYAQGEYDTIYRVVVSPRFFETLGIPLLQGRAFTEHDREDTPRVAVVNETAARRYFGDERPIGRRFGRELEQRDQVEIIGVVQDVRYDSLREPAPPTVFVPALQVPLASAMFEVRTAADPLGAVPALREAVRNVDPNVPLLDVSTQESQIERRFLQERVLARLVSLFGAMVALVAGIGLFGLLSYSVTRRTGEIGVRMALGAARTDVVRMVASESVSVVAGGIAAGVALSIAGARLISSQLFGLAPTDLRTHFAAIGLMVVVAALAACVPARRATRVDPMMALRAE
jgi:predicted permease